jgi:hypothetical protein
MRHPTNHDLLGGILAAQLGYSRGAIRAPFLVLLLIVALAFGAVVGAALAVVGGLTLATVAFFWLSRAIRWLALAVGFDANARHRLRLKTMRIIESNKKPALNTTISVGVLGAIYLLYRVGSATHLCRQICCGMLFSSAFVLS